MQQEKNDYHLLFVYATFLPNAIAFWRMPGLFLISPDTPALGARSEANFIPVYICLGIISLARIAITAYICLLYDIKRQYFYKQKI